MLDVTEIHFRDLAKREQDQQDDLRNRMQQLLNFEKNRPGLTSDEEKDMDRIKKILKAVGERKEVCDPMFVGIRDLFNANQGILGFELKGHENGRLKFTPTTTAEQEQNQKKGAASHTAPPAAYIRAALTVGLALADKVAHPPVYVTSTGEVRTDRSNPLYAQLSRGFFAAIGETQSMFDLAAMALPLLGIEGDPDGRGGNPSLVDTGEFAEVMRALVEKEINTKEPQLRRRINECLDKIQYVGENRPITELGIDLPDLDTTTDADVVSDNVRLMGPMVCAAMFDELKAFQVVDKLVELFQHGMLPIGSGEAGKLLYKYWKEAPNRMSESERKNFYAMTMGIPGGESSGMVNRDFNDLWLRFVSSVSSFVRQNEVDKLLRSGMPSAISGQQVRKAARDLAANLSLHGYGMAYYAALDMQDQIRTIIKLLSDPDIRSAYGARDMWQVVDQVATLELGGAKTSSRYRTLATCGAIITAWLADNVSRIMRPTGPIIDIKEVLSPVPKSSGQKATTHPSDYDLVNACELWLADTATSDLRVDEMSQPREAPVMTSKPVQIPSIARDMLESVGMGLSYPGSAAHSNGYARHH
ncbi:MAG: hypothetical protein V4633_17020 [Pseudomonadota bacterium]